MSIIEHKWNNGKPRLYTTLNYNGNYHVELRKWYESGKLEEHSFWDDGCEHGEVKWWHPNGRFGEHSMWEHGDYCGEFKLWKQYNPCNITGLRSHEFLKDNIDLTEDVIDIVNDIKNITDEEKLLIKLKFGIGCL